MKLPFNLTCSVIILLSFSACKKNDNTILANQTVSPASTFTAAPRQVAFIFHPHTDTFYGQWNQTVYGSFPSGIGYSSLYVHYLNDSVLVFKSPSFGVVNRNIGISGIINAQRVYSFGQQAGDGYESYTFTLKNDSLKCIMDQTDGMCGGDDYPGTYTAYKTNHGTR